MTQHDKQTILVKILQELWNTWMVHYFEERRYYIVYNPYRALQLEAKKQLWTSSLLNKSSLFGEKNQFEAFGLRGNNRLYSFLGLIKNRKGRQRRNDYQMEFQNTSH